MFILPHLKGLTAGNIGSAAFKSASLDLKFADNKSLTDAVTGASLVTFTRASNGTYTDSAGVLQTAATDVPRFDHDPTTGEAWGCWWRSRGRTASQQHDGGCGGWYAGDVCRRIGLLRAAGTWHYQRNCRQLALKTELLTLTYV